MKKHSAAVATANNIYGVINEMAINEDQYNKDGHVPFVYAIVFEDDTFYIGCKYSRHYGAHPSMLLSEQYNSSSKVVKERVTRVPHKRYIIGIGTSEEVAVLEQQVVKDLWSVPGRLNGVVPTGIVVAPHSQETRDKISKACMGNKHAKGGIRSQEQRNNSAKVNKERHRNRWSRDRIDLLINLRECHKLTFKEIGSIMGISLSTAYINYYRHKS